MSAISAQTSQATLVDLRPVCRSDEETVYSLLSDERVVRYTLCPLFTREQARTFVHRLQWPPPISKRSRFVFSIVNRADHSFVGLCGLVRELPKLQIAEIWYFLAPSYWGYGFATAAAHKLVDHGFRTLALHRIWASCVPENAASVRVLEKLGFRHEGLLQQKLPAQETLQISYLYTVLSAEWNCCAWQSGSEPDVEFNGKIKIIK